ncbi:hypothetical protein GCM10017673_26200 [Streptosporangium violaceochromogenes]|nr:hypothetical protein GCM10017673_26200 [Streptosporangium violaceochromogenes]
MILLAGAAVIAVSWDEATTTTATASFTVFDRAFQLSQLEFFFAGAVTGVVFLFGVALLLGGMRRSSVRRRKLYDSRLQARDRVARLEREKEELERKLEKTPATTTAAAAADRDRDRDGDGDGVDDRAETTAPHPRVEVPHQHDGDRLVAGRHGRPANGQ